MWQNLIENALGSRAKVRILRCLLDAHVPISGREIARRTGLSHTGVMNTLDELDGLELVWPSPGASSSFYRLNRSHELVRGGLEPLFETERSMEERLAASIVEAVPEAISIVLFGSVARGEDKRSSDIDLLVIVPDHTDTYVALDRIFETDPIARWGRLLSPIIFTKSHLQTYWTTGMPLLRAVMDEGRLLHGEPLVLLTRGAARAG